MSVDTGEQRVWPMKPNFVTQLHILDKKELLGKNDYCDLHFESLLRTLVWVRKTRMKVCLFRTFVWCVSVCVYRQLSHIYIYLNVNNRIFKQQPPFNIHTIDTPCDRINWCQSINESTNNFQVTTYCKAVLLCIAETRSVCVSVWSNLPSTIEASASNPQIPHGHHLKMFRTPE